MYINKVKNYKTYKRMFEQEIDSNKEIRTADGKKVLKLRDGEVWTQCYAPGDKIRSKLPKYWFINKWGNIISVASGKAVWMKKDNSLGNGRYSYHFTFTNQKGESVCKIIKLHDLVRIVYGGVSYGKADQILQEKGIYAFKEDGSGNETVHGHHIGRKSNNTAGNIEFLTAEAHKVLHQAPKNPTVKNVEQYLRKLDKMASKEEPNKVTVVVTGERYDKDLNRIENAEYNALVATNKLKFSEQALNELQFIINQEMSGRIIEIVVKELVNTSGKDYFAEPKYLCANDLFYRCEKIDDNLKISEVGELEVANQNIIACFIGSDNYVSYVEENQEVEANV